MFTDIVRYTALMGSDEDYAFEVLAKIRKIHSKIICILSGVFRRRPRAFKILAIIGIVTETFNSERHSKLTLYPAFFED